MLARSLSHLSDDALLQSTESLSGRRRHTIAELLLHIAEVDRRKLHLRLAYTSLSRYCVGALQMSTESAFKHARAARMTRRYPGILAAVAEGRLHLSAIVMLAPYVDRGSAAELLKAAEHKTRSQIALLLAERFPNPDVPTSVRALPAAQAMAGLALASDDSLTLLLAPPGASASSQLAPGPVCMTTPPHQRVALCCAGLLRGARGPAPGHIARPLGYASCFASLRLRAGSALMAPPTLRLAASHAPAPDHASRAVACVNPAQRGPDTSRNVLTAVRRAVWLRDEGRCTFESPSGVRCDSRTAVQIDHVVPFALGGRSSVENLRLLCRAHNQYEAERVFGERFIEGKTEQSRAQAAREKLEHGANTSHAPGHVTAHSPTRAHVDEVVPYLLALKVPKPEARHAAEMCADMPHASLEERVKVALQGLGRARHQRCTRAPSAVG